MFVLGCQVLVEFWPVDFVVYYFEEVVFPVINIAIDVFNKINWLPLILNYGLGPLLCRCFLINNHRCYLSLVLHFFIIKLKNKYNI